MPLSEHEQKILSEIERRLAEEDPKFARNVAAQSPQGQTVRRLKRVSLSFVAGFALLITGLVLGGTWLIILGLAAFAVMLFSVAVMSALVRRLGHEHPPSSAGNRDAGWRSRIEERFRRRLDRDDEN